MNSATSTNAQPNADRDALIARIHKLRAMSTAAGCTEAEAQAAMAKVAQLIAAHNIGQDELAIRREAAHCLTDEFTELNSAFADWMQCGPPIARVYGTRCWASRAHEDPLELGTPTMVAKLRFFGLPADVAASVTTAAIIFSAVTAESLAFKGHRPSFRAGMIARLCDRLRAMARETAAPTGTSLIVLKDALVTDEYAKLNLRLRHTSTRTAIVRSSAAYAAGTAAGSRVDLGGAKVTHGTGQRAISQRAR